MFDKILIANRGEIALRVLRAARSSASRRWRCIRPRMRTPWHVRLARRERVHRPAGRQGQLLNIPALLTACEITGADAVHPGYGFLSENARFAEILGEHNIHFIGRAPSTSA